MYSEHHNLEPDSYSLLKLKVQFYPDSELSFLFGETSCNKNVSRTELPAASCPGHDTQLVLKVKW